MARAGAPRRTGLIRVVAILFAAALARDSFDDWIDRTALPALTAET